MFSLFRALIARFLNSSIWNNYFSYETITIEKIIKGGNLYGKIRYRPKN